MRKSEIWALQFGLSSALNKFQMVQCIGNIPGLENLAAGELCARIRASCCDSCPAQVDNGEE
jgi:hypothetical protein